ncbi:MAG: amidase [Candidatus Acidiferrales bacterium]
MSEIASLSATALAEQIRRRKISPREAVEAHLRRIEKLNPALNAFVSLRAEEALDDARAAEAALEAKQPLGPLHGVPISIKSSIDVAGLPCETGSRLRAGHIPSADAPLVARLRAAGAIVLGNTNVPELLMAYHTENHIYGRTNSPWDTNRTPGGSSGGEAAAIAAGCAAAGVGSDGGGSIRVPAHFSGICGLKPTPGRIPSTGHYPPNGGPFTFLGVVGPMARTVADLSLLLEVMAGPDIGDPSAAPVPFQPMNDQDARRLTVGWFEDDGRAPVTRETRAAVRRAAEALASAGFSLRPFRPEGLEKARQLWDIFFCRGAAMVLAPVLQGAEWELPILKEYKNAAGPLAPLTAEAWLDAWMARDALVVEMLKQMQSLPIWLCPVCSVPAFRHQEREWVLEGKKVSYLDAMSYTQWFNLLGFPAAVVPVGRSPEGLPIGVQVVGRPFEEAAVLAVAAWIERECGGFQAPPANTA